jgi:hypothetical protein
MPGNVVISEMDSVMYGVRGEEEKHVPRGKLVGTTECVTLWPRCRQSEAVITYGNYIYTDN